MDMSDFVLADSSKYLSQSQIDHAKEELEAIGNNFDDFVNVLALIDRYVKNNETADDRYNALYRLLTGIDGALKMGEAFDEPIRATLPLISGIAFYDYLVLTGVLTSADLQNLATNPIHGMNRGGIPQA